MLGFLHENSWRRTQRGSYSCPVVGIRLDARDSSRSTSILRADHYHGGVPHAHGVTVHTVLSSDLDGEFGDHHDSGLPEETSAEVAFVDHPSHSLDEHPEVGFALLNDSSERKAFKPFFTQAIAIDSSDVPSNDRYIWTVNYPVPIRASTIFVHDSRSRAPPILLA